MAGVIAYSANEHIEKQLGALAADLEKATQSHVVAFIGPIIGRIDDLLRVVIEEKQQSPSANKKLTVLLTTVGGYIETVQRIVDMFRHHYDIVDFIIPNHAFSAGTVLALSGDCIYMDYYSRLGPIDPQVESQGGRMVSALGYLKQYEEMLKKANKGKATMAEMELLLDFDQAELYQYKQARELSISLLKEWLVKYKFKNWTVTQTRGLPVTDKMKMQRAAKIARELNNTEKWHVHGNGISMEVLGRDLKLHIDDFGALANLNTTVRQYHNLLEDYMTKLDNKGVVHTANRFVPFM